MVKGILNEIRGTDGPDVISFMNQQEYVWEIVYFKRLIGFLISFRIQKDFEANPQRTGSHRTVTIPLTTSTVADKVTVKERQKRVPLS